MSDQPVPSRASNDQSSMWLVPTAGPAPVRQLTIPLARILPPTSIAKPPAVEANRLAPAVASVGAFSYGVGSLLVSGGLLTEWPLPFVFSGIAFAVVYAMAWMLRLFRQGMVDDRWRLAVEREFAAPYTRYRVQSRADGTDVVLEIVAYEPRHAVGSAPSYQTSTVVEERHDAGDEIGVFESLAELREEAEERERASAEGWESVIHAMELQERVLEQLPHETIPRLHQ